MLGELGADLVHRSREIDFDDLAADLILGDFGQVLRRICLELLEEDAVGGDLAEDLAVGRT